MDKTERDLFSLQLPNSYLERLFGRGLYPPISLYIYHFQGKYTIDNRPGQMEKDGIYCVSKIVMLSLGEGEYEHGEK